MFYCAGDLGGVHVHAWSSRTAGASDRWSEPSSPRCATAGSSAAGRAAGRVHRPAARVRPRHRRGRRRDRRRRPTPASSGSGRGSSEPLRKHPLDRPVRVGARPARRRRHLDAARPRRRQRRSRRQPACGSRSAGATSARGHITDIECFEPEADRERRRDRPRERPNAPVRFMQQVISLDYVDADQPGQPLRSAEQLQRGADHRPQVPVVRARLRAAPGLLPDLRGRDDRRADEVEVATRASSRRGRCSRRSSTTARTSGRTTRWPASCSTAPTARSASSASSTSRSTRSAWACGSRRCGPTEAERERRRRPRATASAPPSPGLRADRRARRRPRRLRGAHAVRDVAIVSFAQSGARVDVEETETQMLYPGHHRGHRAVGHRPRGDRVHLLGQRRLPRRRAVRLRRATSRPPARGRRSPSRTSRWTAPGRSTRRGSGSSTATSTSRSCSRRASRRAGNLREVLCLQNDPYYLMPLWVDHVSLAALQARALPRRHRRQGGRPGRGRGPQPPQRARQPERAGVRRPEPPTSSSPSRTWSPRCRASDCPPVTDGAAAVVLVAGDRAREVCERPAWIRGIDHRIDPHYPGVRDLTPVRVGPARGRAGRRRRRAGRGGRAGRRRSATRS